MGRTRACETRKDTVRIALTRMHVEMVVCEYINDGVDASPGGIAMFLCVAA